MSEKRRQDIIYPPGPETQRGQDQRGRRLGDEVPTTTGRLFRQFWFVRHDEEAILRVLRQVPRADRFHARIALFQTLGGQYTSAGPRALVLCERVFGPGAMYFPSEREIVARKEQGSPDTLPPSRPVNPVPEPAQDPEGAFEQGRIQTLCEHLKRLTSQSPYPPTAEILILLDAAESHVAKAALSRLNYTPLPGEDRYGKTYYQALQQAAGESVSDHLTGRREMLERILPGLHKADRLKNLRPLPLETRLLRAGMPRGVGQLLASWDKSVTPEAKAQRHAGAEERLTEDHPALATLGQGGGEPLPEAVLGRMNRLLAHDFSHVRIHTDTAAAEAAKLLGARALTLGTHIYFGASQYAPGETTGDRLLIHELVHVVQFDEGRLPATRGAGIEVSRPNDGTEQEAEARAQDLAVASRDKRNVMLSGGRRVETGTDPVEAASDATGAKRPTGATAQPPVPQIQRQATGNTAGPGLTQDTGPALLDRILGWIQQIPSFLMPRSLREQLQGLRSFVTGASRVLQSPQLVLDALRNALAGMIAQIPAQVQATIGARVPSAHVQGVLRHLEPKLEYLKEHWWEVIQQTGRDLLWPWPGVASDLRPLWNHLRQAGQHIWAFEVSAAIDSLLAAWRVSNDILGRLYGWFFVASVLIGAIVGAFFGGVGAIPGAAAGARVALAAGQSLLVSVVVAETASIAKSIVDLQRGQQTLEETEQDYEQIAGSSVTLGVTAIMAGAGALAARFARALTSRLAGRVWRLPARRGPRGTRNRGDVAETRVLQSERVRTALRLRQITWLEQIRRNFPVIDLLEGGTVSTTRQGRRTLYTIRGGILISVKSVAQTGQAGINEIRRCVRELASFQQVQNVRVTNPTGRRLVMVHEGQFSAAQMTQLRGYAQQYGVNLELTTALPSHHPVAVAVESVPQVLRAAGVVGGDTEEEGVMNQNQHEENAP